MRNWEDKIVSAKVFVYNDRLARVVKRRVSVSRGQGARLVDACLTTMGYERMCVRQSLAKAASCDDWTNVVGFEFGRDTVEFKTNVDSPKRTCRPYEENPLS